MKNTMLDLASNAVEDCLIFAVGVSPAAAMASATFTWSAVRSSLNSPAQWVTSRRTTMRKYLLAMIAVISAAGLAGCAGQSDQLIQFFKPYGPGQVEQRYVGMHIFTVSETDQTPPVQK